MSTGRPAASLRLAALRPAIRLYGDKIERGRESYPLEGVRAEVSVTGTLRKRRLLTIAGPGFAWSQQITGARVYEARARAFAAQVNAAAAVS